MVSKLISNASIDAAELLVSKNILLRPYVYPWVVVYAVFAHVYYNHYDTYIVGQEWTFVYLCAIMSTHALTWLLPQWNLNLQSGFNYSPVGSVAEARYIKITPAPNSGVGAIVPINRYTYDGELQVSFLYQKRRHILDAETGVFSPPDFAVDHSPEIAVIRDARGLTSAHQQLARLERTYGKNQFDIPIPTFVELFKEHAVAPFFVFQIFSVALWCMDEFWYYSLFTLFMLVSFECTTVWQRRATMTEFQSMGIKPYDVYVYRDAAWTKVSTVDLLPGDVISVTRTDDESALPCDLVIMDGECIVNEAMLTGESTPLLKESIRTRRGTDTFDPEGEDKNSVLHGGTACIQVTAPEKSTIPLAPDHGALAYVAKTGFETSQGSLVRVMIFSTERVSVGNKESMYFLLFLLVFAIIASWYVWVEGTRMGRIQSKLILDCILILTSVVPPELPMELTMAVNSSLAALGKHYVFCTEPFRIPFGGRIDVCCFDKTGTLTAEDLVFEGLAGFHFGDDITKLSSPQEVPEVTSFVLGAAHALVKLDDGEVVGDPMEKATLNAARWKVGEKDTVTRAHGKKTDKIHILRRFQFSSALKRSSSIAAHNGKTLVAVKGAPETIRGMLTSAPEKYEETFKSFTRSGSRVLALAYKYLDDNTSSSKISKLAREDVECDLQFAGFLVFHCPLKPDAVETVKMLNESSHRCIMITGDNPLTAVHVAKEVEIVDREVLILDLPEEHHGDHELVWRNIDESKIIPFSTKEQIPESYFQNYDICVTGYALAKLMDHEQLRSVIRHTWVYARVSPSQKEFILTSLKDMGYNTLMCGDGTNDVGALKQAHVGVALLNGTEDSLKKMQEQRKLDGIQKMYQKQCDMMAKWNQPQPKVPLPIAHLYPPGPANPNYLKAMEKQGMAITDETRRAVALANAQPVGSAKSEGAKALVEQMMSTVNDMEEDNEEEAPVLKLGDASVAAPFTSKLSNVSSVTHIIRQGRCALVSTIQMYKILALNCLISAYSLSVIYLAGVKFGDGQATISGLLISVCFYSVSRGRPIEKLSKERPQPGIFNIYIMGSILGQFAIHIITLVYINREIYLLEPREPSLDLEKEFTPSLLNTAIFLLQLAQQVSTFAVNYQGLPFRESIKDNRGMYYGLLGVAFLALAGSTEFMPELNEAMKFVPMTGLFKVKLTSCILLDLGATWAIELVLKHYYSDFKAADIALR